LTDDLLQSADKDQ